MNKKYLKCIDKIETVLEQEGIVDEFFQRYNATACRNFCRNTSRVWLFDFDRKIKKHNLKKEIDYIYNNNENKDEYDCPYCGEELE